MDEGLHSHCIPVGGADSVTRKKVVSLFGTRPEVIKLAPVIRHLEHSPSFRTINVTSAQHTDLLYPFVRLFDLRIDYDLQVMQAGQTPNQVCARVLNALEPLLLREQPDLLLVQGDTTTALAGALAGFHHRIPVGHVEAGLRSGDPRNPYPEEMNRRLISQLATYHFAATPQNRDNLLAEGVADAQIFVTGNPIVDALHTIVVKSADDVHAPSLASVLAETTGLKRVALTTHRRESFGSAMSDNLCVLRHFVETRPDVALLFPVHPNPAVRKLAGALLSQHPRIYLLPPLDYPTFLSLLSKAWLIVSDSGGIQEEAPTLPKPVLILRENTERPEAIAAGVARLVGGCPQRLADMLEEVYQDSSWMAALQTCENPFGRGDSGHRIVQTIAELLGISQNPLSHPSSVL
ncbi:MAG: UDP-N-acetylglucosamine 2-epimerase (non-hydrolyzing) [Deltaproteobacteria bacterium]|nr:UDP-N-acetylglucosamine 2-epimerase (non-hydrolyzing) [Deltaproteobacteria bacterium]